jgi:hypothetical protein
MGVSITYSSFVAESHLSVYREIFATDASKVRVTPEAKLKLSPRSAISSLVKLVWQREQ